MDAVTRFNEAPALVPGKATHRRSRDIGSGRGFNEAPALVPGKASASLARSGAGDWLQ